MVDDAKRQPNLKLQTLKRIDLADIEPNSPPAPELPSPKVHPLAICGRPRRFGGHQLNARPALVVLRFGEQRPDRLRIGLHNVGRTGNKSD